jgi:hypothetical protein
VPSVVLIRGWFPASVVTAIGVVSAGIGVAGVIFDTAASYALALPIAAAMALLAPTLLWFVAPRRPNPAPST